MSTATEPTLRCGTCAGDIALPDVIRINNTAWKCPNCGTNNAWMVTPPGNQGPFVTPRSLTPGEMLMDEFDKGSKKVKKAASHILNRMPGMGKSKVLKKWVKKENKRRKKLNLPLLATEWIKLGNVEPKDLMGFMIPVTEPDGTQVSDFTPPPWFTPSVAVRDTSGSIPPQTIKDFADEIEKVTQPSNKWDLRDQDGDVHSPAWYLDAFMIARQEYHEALSTDTRTNTREQDIAHIGLMDELLVEMNMYGTFVNRLLGYDMVEGEWDKAKNEDVSE